jgi:hypothetical protein
VATNPGPCSSSTSNRTVKCLSLNAWSLTSLHRTNNSEGKRSNMELVQNLVCSELGQWYYFCEWNLAKERHLRSWNSALRLFYF